LDPEQRPPGRMAGGMGKTAGSGSPHPGADGGLAGGHRPGCRPFTSTIYARFGGGSGVYNPGSQRPGAFLLHQQLTPAEQHIVYYPQGLR